MFTGKLAIEGGAELQRKLDELDRKIANTISRQALRAGSKVVLAAAKRFAPIGSTSDRGGKIHKAGTLKRSLKVRAGKRRKGQISFAVQTAAGDYRGDTFYGAFVEYGHKIGKRIRGKGQKHLDAARRSVPPNPFLTSAFYASKDAALSTIIETTRAGILQAAAK
jgi:HK97 gp10 family phage protein